MTASPCFTGGCGRHYINRHHTCRCHTDSRRTRQATPTDVILGLDPRMTEERAVAQQRRSVEDMAWQGNVARQGTYGAVET
ncbi:hypothetical protein B5M44_24365 [Shinella sumterensis]|nr:hypothetical protein B5M44_24365 [Shinella sumterensis]